MAWLWMLAAVGASLAIGLAFRSTLGFGSRSRAAAWALASLATAMTPCLVPLGAQPQRLIAALVATALMVKLYDVFVQAKLARQMTLVAYAVYLVNWFQLVLAKKPPHGDAGSDRTHAVRFVPLGIGLLGLFVALFLVDWRSLPFALEHSLKVATLIVGISMTTSGLASVWRLFGGDAIDPMRRPELAPTPSEFWRRWNRPAQQFLHVYVYEPIARRLSPLVGMLATFAVSAIVHEYLFSVAAGRVQGWQLLFFAVQGIAAAATARFRPHAPLTPIFVALTIAFELSTGVWFFASVAEILPFYSTRT
jgi:hypothetical protein